MNWKQMLKLADIFNAPSDDEDFFGFGPDVPMETGSPEDSCESFDSLEARKMPRHLTQELREVFTEDTASENEEFEGFSSNEHDINDKKDVEVWASYLLHLTFYNCPFHASSGLEEDAKEAPEDNSSALLKRAMNIKENKAMLAQLLAELNSLPDLFPVKTSTSTPKQKKPPRKKFSEGQIERRTNPTRNARPPEKFALENFTATALRFAEQLHNYRQQNLLKKKLKGGSLEVPKRRRLSKYGSCRPVEDITDEDLDNVAITVKDKIYDKVLGSTCHQCRQKTIDTKTICRNEGCGGVRGQFCGPCLRNRYGEDVKSALLDPDWFCPPCRGICNCSYCRKRDGRCATGMLIHLAKFYGHDNVKEYLESLQKQLAEDN
ncbi:cell division cycle-associated 7-like protein [Sceloporus undulatus]|uniref:cell division cycle-associated 7-like protein n=1 Tax=Sceloporus undulatus TaxID=8520 RepID=UPI001C4AD49D|nr:cell division cycle-associated 7-like protein [Sceloporus undulatus]